jgi:integrase
MPVYKDKKRGTWYYQINYKDIQGEYRQKRQSGFATRKEAQNQEYLAGLELNRTPNQSDISFEDLYNYYFSYIEGEIKYTSWYSKKNLGDLHILPYFIGKRANQISTNDIIAWKKIIVSKGFAYEYLSKIYTNLSSIFSYGIKHHGLKDNPCRLVGNFKNPEELEEELQYWTHDEFKEFISKITNDLVYLVFFSFLYFMGTRKGEAMALSWKDINFDNHTVSIAKTVAEKSKEGGWKITPPKTKSSIRRILMPKELERMLKIYYEYCKQFEDFSDDSFVFGIYRPLATTTIQRTFDKYLALTNLKKIKIHDLRHSHASLLINLGANVLIVSKRLGHKDVNETLNTYSHMFPNKEKEVVDLIDNL